MKEENKERAKEWKEQEDSIVIEKKTEEEIDEQEKEDKEKKDKEEKSDEFPEVDIGIDIFSQQ